MNGSNNGTKQVRRRCRNRRYLRGNHAPLAPLMLWTGDSANGGCRHLRKEIGTWYACNSFLLSFVFYRYCAGLRVWSTLWSVVSAAADCCVDRRVRSPDSVIPERPGALEGMRDTSLPATRAESEHCRLALIRRLLPCLRSDADYPAWLQLRDSSLRGCLRVLVVRHPRLPQHRQR